MKYFLVILYALLFISFYYMWRLSRLQALARRLRPPRFHASLLHDGGEGELVLRIQFLGPCTGATPENTGCESCLARSGGFARFSFNGGIGRMGWNDILEVIHDYALLELWEQLCDESAKIPYEGAQIVFMTELASVIRMTGREPRVPEHLVLLNDQRVGRIWAQRA